ncbi:ATP cone domain-containing protein [Klebsiella pneumoniae]|uniref:ATP cone domain-containing protein n=1 Tax=Klebsiella pneumoniae TaxID=573 RepID=UPI003D9798E1
MKRDGCKVPFKSERIKEAILRAAKAAAEVDDGPIIAPLLPRLSASRCRAATRWITMRSRPAVENQLMSGPYKQLARALHRVPSRSRH